MSYIFTFGIIQYLGRRASENSKKRGSKKFDYQAMQEKYIQGAKALIQEKQVKGVIAGHTHVPAFEIFEDGTEYYNCGFPIRNQHFLIIDQNKIHKYDLNLTE